MDTVISEGKVRVPDAGVGLGKAGEPAEGEHSHKQCRGKGVLCQSQAAGDLQQSGKAGKERRFFKEQVADHEKYHIAAEPCDGAAGGGDGSV